MKFETLNLNSRLLQSISDRGYTDMTDVQEKTLAQTLEGRDVAVQSQTGTGKTAAFLITLYEIMLKSDPDRRGKALIIVPTRELAVQIEEEADLLNHNTDFSVCSFYGGVGYDKQLSALSRGVDIAIGTPGRLIDLSQRRNLRLKEYRYLVIDEADRLFDMGFLPDIQTLIQSMPPKEKRYSMLFSATLNRASRQLAFEHLMDPVFIEVTPEQMTVDSITQELYHVKSHIKLNLMLGILKRDNPKNALIFTNTRHKAFDLAKRLTANGYRARHITGDLPQKQRLQVMDDFKSGRFAFLVATDVAARGLQIDGLEMVINYDVPQDCENYVHRIGRTARMGNAGKAVTLASEQTFLHQDAIEKFIGERIPVLEPDSSLYEIDKSLQAVITRKFQKFTSRRGETDRPRRERDGRSSSRGSRQKNTNRTV